MKIERTVIEAPSHVNGSLGFLVEETDDRFFKKLETEDSYMEEVIDLAGFERDDYMSSVDHKIFVAVDGDFSGFKLIKSDHDDDQDIMDFMNECIDIIRSSNCVIVWLSECNRYVAIPLHQWNKIKRIK